MSDNVVSLASRRKPVTYSIYVEHFPDEQLNIGFSGLTSDPTLREKQLMLDVLKRAVAVMEVDIDCHQQRDNDIGRPSDT